MILLSIFRHFGQAGAVLLIFTTFLTAQETSDGPVIEGYGQVFRIDDPGLEVDPDKDYKVVFDITDSPKDPHHLNVSFNTLARFLNMHAQAGVPAERLHVAAVLHGGATDDGLTAQAYRQRHGTDNPNLDLLHQLQQAGVKLYVCGQSLMGQGFQAGQLDPSVKTALSAMTALISLQDEGYRLIAW